MATIENLPLNVIKQLVKELKNLDEIPPEGIKVIVNDDDFSTIYADIEGPGRYPLFSHIFLAFEVVPKIHETRQTAAGTPYENGIFHMKLLLSRDFPQSPPKGYFLTKIFHPNIATNGEICVNTLKKDWNPSLGLRHVVLVVRCLLIEPFPESALNEQAGKMLLEDYEEYARHARLFTGIHALKSKPKSKSKSGAISESTTALNVDKKKEIPSSKVPLPPTPLGASAACKGSGPNCQDENVVAAVAVTSSEPAVAASAVQKRVAAPPKSQVDKKKMDARRKSLKRL